MTCPFSTHLVTYRGPAEPLQEHLRSCVDCRVAAGVIAASTMRGERTPDCPDESVLAAYDEGVLDDQPDYEDSIRHLRDCDHCAWRLIELKREETTLEESLTQLQSGNAYILAKQLAEWLATEAFPREEMAVKGSFESTYHAMTGERQQEGSEAADRGPELVGLAFMGKSGLSLAQKIVALSALAGQLRGSEAGSAEDVANELENRRSALEKAGLSAQLIHKAIEHLRT